MARVVSRVVVEGPLAVVGAAGLEPRPGPVGHRGGGDGEQPPECRVHAPGRRLEPDLAARVEAKAEVRPRCRPVERQRRLLAHAQPVVLEQQSTDRLAEAARGDEIRPASHLAPAPSP